MQCKHVACVVLVCSGFVFKGYECEPFNNPADFFLDVINGDSTAVAASKDDRVPVDTGKGKLQRRNSLLASVGGYVMYVMMASFYSLVSLNLRAYLYLFFVPTNRYTLFWLLQRDQKTS